MKKGGQQKRAHWSNGAFHLVIEVLNQSYIIAKVCRIYNILRSLVKNHMGERTRSKKMEPKTILTQDEEKKLCEYIDMMVHWGHPMKPTQLKKMVQIKTSSFGSKKALKVGL